MLYIFMGQSCTGKSTVADKAKELTGAEVFTGKDYLRMAKDENQAWRLFYEKLSNAASGKGPKETIIYLITEKGQLDKIIDIEGSCKIKFTATLDTIKSRFAQRMNGNLPQPVEKMLTKQYEEWESIKGDINVDTTVDGDIEKILNLIDCGRILCVNKIIINEEKNMEILGTEIDLLPYTIERCHEFWKDYVADYNMTHEEYIYDENLVNKYYQVKVLDENRKFFAICRNGKTIGEIQLKRIDFKDKHGTMSIVLSNNNHKNKGYGTEAERLLINYAFESLGLKCIYADTILRNKRSQYVLERLGFTKIDEDDVLIYYELKCK